MNRNAMTQWSGLPDYGYGPMTQETISGRQNAYMYEPAYSTGNAMFDYIAPYLPRTIAERVRPVFAGIFDYGPEPAKAVVDEVDRAGNAMSRSIDNPSIPNLGETAVRTLMLGGAPVRAAGAAGAAYGAAALQDAFSPTSARAADPAEIERRLKSMPEAQVRDLQRALGVPVDGRVGGQTINALYERESTKERREAAERGQATDIARIEAEARGRSEAEKERIRVETEARSASGRESADRIAGAKRQLVTDLTASRTPAKDSSAVGQLYEQLGVLTPLAAGVAGGMGYRMAKPALATGNKFVDDYMNPALAGAEIGGSVALAPTYAQAYRGDPTNPEYRAWQNYELALPAEATDERSRVPRNTPQIDPAVTKARDSLNDPVFRGQAMLQGGLGGIFGNVAGAAAGRVPAIAGDLAEGAARMPQRLYRSATTPPNFTDEEMQAIIGAKQRAALLEAKNPKVKIPPPTFPQGGGPVPPSGGAAQPPAAQGSGQPLTPPSPQPAPRRLRNSQSEALKNSEKDLVLRQLASGETSGFTTTQQAYADRLNNMSTALGVDASALLKARGTRSNPWAATGALPVGAYYSTEDDENNYMYNWAGY